MFALVALAFGLGVAGCSSSSSSRGSGTTTAATTSSTNPTAPVTSAQTATGGSQLVLKGSLDVLTYNVAGLPQGLSSSNPATNMVQISPKLNTYPLVFVQEDFFYHAELMRLANHPFQTTPQGIVSSRPVNDGLNAFSAVPFSGHARVTWTDCHGLVGNGNDCLATKGFSFARYELAPGVEVDVYNLHADAGGDPGDEAARLNQFAQLAQYIAANSSGRALIVAGDTNLKATRSRDLQVLADFLGVTGLRDSARELGNHPDLIDRIMVRDGNGVVLQPTLWRLADEFVDASGAALSDHPAVHVRLAWSLYR